MTNSGSNLSRQNLIEEIELNLWETWSNWGRGPDCSLHDEPDLLWVETPLPIVPFNGVFRCRLPTDSVHRIDEIVAHFRQRHVQFHWLVHSTAQPVDLRARLIAAGLVDVEPIYAMARSLENLPPVPPPPDGVDIHKVQDDRDVVSFLQFAMWRWNVPEQFFETYNKIVKPFRFGLSDSRAHAWQAIKDGVPVAKVGSYFGSGSAGIYAVATKPEARGLGLARTLTLTALHEAKNAGYELSVLHSTPMSQTLYEKMGFATYGEFRLFASSEVHV